MSTVGTRAGGADGSSGMVVDPDGLEMRADRLRRSATRLVAAARTGHPPAEPETSEEYAAGMANLADMRRALLRRVEERARFVERSAGEWERSAAAYRDADRDRP